MGCSGCIAAICRQCCRIEQFFAQGGGEHVAANLYIIGFSRAAIDMENQRGGQRHVERTRSAAIITGAAIAGKRIEVKRRFRDIARNTLVDDIDRAADRVAAEQQHRWPAQDFHTLGRKRINRDSMVDGGVGRIERADPVCQHAHSRSLKTAQNGAGSAWRKAGCADPGHAGQAVANLSAQILGQVIAGQHRCTGENIELFDIAGGDDNLFIAVAMKIIIGLGGVVGLTGISALRDGGGNRNGKGGGNQQHFFHTDTRYSKRGRIRM